MPEPTTAARTNEVADVEAIHAVYVSLMDAWNSGDAAAFAATFAPDGDLVGFDGTHLRGREEIAAFHRTLFDTYVKGSRLVGIVRSVRFLARDIAVMHAVGGTVMAGQSDIDPDRNSIQTMTVVRAYGAWQLATFQNTRTLYYGRPEVQQALTKELRTLL